MRRLTLVVVCVVASLALPGAAHAVPGDLLGTVMLPGNGACSVAGTFDGTYYLTMSGCPSDTVQVYLPPASGNGAATLVSSKSIVDGTGNPVSVSALAWDPSRGMVWGAYANQVWLIDIGDPTVSASALAAFQFAPGVGGVSLVDGLAYDGSDDTLYHSPDVDCFVHHFSLGTGGNPPLGTLMNTVTPKNAAGASDCQVSGVTVGSGNTLYIGRNGASEIRRVDKTTGDFIFQFATTAGRVEDLTCDPVTYAPKEAVLAKDAFSALYEAFEVEAGTCPLPAPQLDHFKCYTAKGKKLDPRPIVVLSDQFGTSRAVVRKPKTLCNPVDKNREGISDPLAHLTCYSIREGKGKWFRPSSRRSVELVNQFGSQRLRIKHAQTLCTPSSKSLLGQDPGPPPTQLDHFKCYRAKGTAPRPRPVVTLADQFGTGKALVGKPVLYCNPVSKNDEGIRQPDQSLVCYAIKPRERIGRWVVVRNQFGTNVLKVKRSETLCVPSRRDDRLPDLTVGIARQVIPVSCFGTPVICTTTVLFTIRNIGTALVAAGTSFQVLLRADPGLSISKTVVVTVPPGGLPPGGSMPMQTELMPPSGNCYDPDCTVQAVVDSTNVIMESNEGNNVDNHTVLG